MPSPKRIKQALTEGITLGRKAMDRLVVAAKGEKGEIIKGKPGQIHMDLLDNPPYPDAVELGFADEAGNWYDREQALKYAREKQGLKINADPDDQGMAFDMGDTDIPQENMHAGGYEQALKDQLKLKDYALSMPTKGGTEGLSAHKLRDAEWDMKEGLSPKDVDDIINDRDLVKPQLKDSKNLLAGSAGGTGISAAMLAELERRSKAPAQP